MSLDQFLSAKIFNKEMGIILKMNCSILIYIKLLLLVIKFF